MTIPRSTFEAQMQHLTDDVLLLSSLVTEAVHRAMSALERMDSKASRQIILADQQVNAKRYQIENDVIVLIATQQPVGRDVRMLAAVLEIITELERIGDYAKGICKIQLLLTEEDHLHMVIQDLKRMADMGLGMLEDALDAFINKDLIQAREIPNRDDLVDQQYNRIRSRLISMMLVDLPHAQSIDYLVWAAHNLERLADRVTNICERIIYVYSGEMKELDGSEQPPL